MGLLVTHIGDGRAGFLSKNDHTWKSIIKPWKGEEANQTIFITSAIWNENIDNFIESRVISEPPLAFTLMSDGVENHSFKCSVFNQDQSRWEDPNEPYPNFFNPLIDTLKKMQASSLSNEDILNKWKEFISTGTQGLSNEPDDKTLILGLIIENTD